ncbi:MAG TPA: MFS transporter [Candidatus Limnocylindria bacterium]|nr:MFS transporter [Candidatus Limnocylindria bacterium]
MSRQELASELEGPATDLAADVEPGRTSALAALRYRDFRLFWFGLLVSNIGTWMQMFGQGYLVVLLAVRDGVPQLAPLYLGLVGLARAVPGLALGLFGGAVADRADRRRLLLVTQSAAAVTAAVLAGLAISDRVNIVEILLLGALNSTIFAFDAPTRQSMVPRLVPEKDLMSAIGLNSAGFNGPQVIGPVIGGLIFAPFAGTPTFGAGLLFGLNAVSYVAVVVALLKMRPVAAVERDPGTTMLDSIREGLAYIRRDVVVRWVIVLTATAALFGRSYLQLLPAFAFNTLNVGPVELSWMLAASGIGSLAGSLVTASLGRFERRGALLTVSAVAFGAILIVFTLQRSLGPALPLLLLLGFVTMLFLGMATTLLQTRSPDHLRGRVMSVQTMMFMGLIPLGSMVMGAIGSVVGIAGGLLTGAIVCTFVALTALVRVAPLRDARAAPRGAGGRLRSSLR